MKRRMLCFLCAVVVGAASASSQEVAWADPSPHTTRLVMVDSGVQLEVLDWGGSGPTVVLLAGLGATAHYYDDLAPTLAVRNRVIGITRRGHRGSSAATGGYDFARLAEDVVHVMDAMSITKAVVIGHSFAGEEMHVLGARHSARIRGLVYVDAAFDRGDNVEAQAFAAAARTAPNAPRPQSDDLASFTALRAYLAKYGGAGPEAHLRARYRTNPDGTVGGPWAPDRAVIQAMTNAIAAGTHPYNPERISAPALALYAAPKSADDLIRHGSSDRLPIPELAGKMENDPAVREQVQQLYLLTRALVDHHEQWFKRLAPRARVMELSGTHDLMISSTREVLGQIEPFIASLPDA